MPGSLCGKHSLGCIRAGQQGACLCFNSARNKALYGSPELQSLGKAPTAPMDGFVSSHGCGGTDASISRISLEDCSKRWECRHRGLPRVLVREFEVREQLVHYYTASVTSQSVCVWVGGRQETIFLFWAPRTALKNKGPSTSLRGQVPHQEAGGVSRSLRPPYSVSLGSRATVPSG